jgi:urease gamma subunit
MPDALEIINSVIAQHGKVTEHVKTTGTRMNDIDAVFSVQRAAYKVAWSASSVKEMLDKRDQLMETLTIMEEGLKKHFAYEEKALPLVFGELLMKDILDAHKAINEQLEKTKATLKGLDGLDKEELFARRTELVDSVHDLRKTVVDHAHDEEEILGMVRKVFEQRPAKN